jgi:hypothetical protein
MKDVTINNERELFVIKSGNGFSCLGFEVCRNKTERLSEELGVDISIKYGTIDAYGDYLKLLGIASQKYQENGWRSKSELVKELIGLEGKRVEVIDKFDEKRRFYVGKSTGWIPCHLEIKTKRSNGGGSVYGAPFKSVRVLY